MTKIVCVRASELPGSACRKGTSLGRNTVATDSTGEAAEQKRRERERDDTGREVLGKEKKERRWSSMI